MFIPFLLQHQFTRPTHVVWHTKLFVASLGEAYASMPARASFLKQQACKVYVSPKYSSTRTSAGNDFFRNQSTCKCEHVDQPSLSTPTFHHKLAKHPWKHNEPADQWFFKVNHANNWEGEQIFWHKMLHFLENVFRGLHTLSSPTGLPSQLCLVRSKCPWNH